MEYVLYGVIGIFLLLVFCIWQNNGIVITNINYKNSKIPKVFNNFKILHVSDLHNKKFGKNQERIIRKIQEINPDIIVITGDSVDCHHTKPEIAYKFLESVAKIVPVYLVSGNHEHARGRYEEFIEEYRKTGVNILDDDVSELDIKNKKIKLLGISDAKPEKFGRISSDTINIFENKLKNVSDFSNKNEFNILLAHRPEFIDLYEKYKFDLVLSGHAHGGQFRFLFIKGVVAPGQGFFPKYTSGLYNKKNTSMIVSRGLGNSVIPIRIFNRPELVVINLEK